MDLLTDDDPQRMPVTTAYSGSSTEHIPGRAWAVLITGHGGRAASITGLPSLAWASTVSRTASPTRSATEEGSWPKQE
ncbi:hypothetical protein [Streptomyces bobili]|uniref:hypothetical protein n=1 Tax=Streptomyces bobili TaxID=67280 RepID=UPI00382F067D